MLLAIDIGNTNVHMGLLRKGRLCGKFGMKTRECHDAGQVLRKLKSMRGSDIGGVCISSVVPSLNRVFRNACKKELGKIPLFATSKNIGIFIKGCNPRQIGADRLVSALAVHAKYKRAVVVVDIGTAVTIDLVTKDGAFAGGAILPGMVPSARALHEMTAKLPFVRHSHPQRAIGKCTKDAIESGIFFGCAGSIDAIVRRISREASVKPMVIATGGDAKKVAKVSETIDRVEPDLVLRGLRIVWEKSHRHNIAL